jgi:hypothetical protein
VDEGNPDDVGNRVPTREGEPNCSDRGRGHCAPCPANAPSCADEDRVSGICVCSPRAPRRDSLFPPDPSTRIACSGETDGPTPSQRCFGAIQPTPERCDMEDWDCDGSDAPTAGSFVDAGKSCSVDRGMCSTGTVVGCSLDAANTFAAEILNAQGVDHNPYWICSEEATLPQPELCNGRDDDCDGKLDLEEQDRDGDLYIGCSGCETIAEPEKQLVQALRGCNDCGPLQSSTHPGAAELCNGIDDNCTNGVADDGAQDDCGTGRDCCPSLIGGACIPITNDPENCGACGRRCSELGGDTCIGQSCVCGSGDTACPAGLDCIDGRCLCVAGGRCAGCCEGDRCVTSFSATQCGQGGEQCHGCDDSNPCTTNGCDTRGRCDYQPRLPGSLCGSDDERCDDSGRCCPDCMIDDQCVAKEQSNPNDLCDWCNPDQSRVSYVRGPSGRPCEDDDLSCTSDTCDSVGRCRHFLLPDYCRINQVCYAEGERNPQNDCEICQPSSSTRYWRDRPNREACTDSNGRPGRCFSGSCCSGCYEPWLNSCRDGDTNSDCGTGGAECDDCGFNGTCEGGQCI